MSIERTVGVIVLSILCLVVFALILFGTVGEMQRESVEESHRKNLRAHLKKMVEALGDVPYSLDFGTLLGYVRENNIILGDEDVDLTVSLSEVNADDIIARLHTKSGFEIRRDGNILKVYDVDNSNISGDIYMRSQVYKDDDVVTHRVDIGGKSNDFPVRGFKDIVETVMFNNDFPVKVVHEDIAKQRLIDSYGENYMTPIYRKKAGATSAVKNLKNRVIRSAMVWRSVLGIRKKPFGERV